MRLKEFAHGFDPTGSVPCDRAPTSWLLAPAANQKTHPWTRQAVWRVCRRQLLGSTVEEVERALVVQTLARYDGNRTQAARVLGLSLRTLRNKIRVYTAEGIEVHAHHC